MTRERWIAVNGSPDAPLTDAEIEEGWHFCNQFDGLLVGPHMFELNFCRCLDPHHKVYNSKPELEQYNENPR